MTKQQLFKLLKRQIEVSRFEAHVRRDLLRRLNKLHRQVKGRIGEEDLDTIGRRELNKLIKDIAELSAVAHAELVRKMDDYSIDLIDNETDFIYKEYGDTWGVPDKKPPVVMPLILGVTASEWLSKQANDYAHSLTMAVRNGDSIDHLPRQLGNKTKAFTTTWARATSQQRQTQIAEKSKKVAGYWHVSVLDSRTSDICLVRSNKRWTMDKQPIDHDLEWKSPPLHPHCRSVMTQITDVSKEPATLTVDDWLDSMSNKEQAQVLGVGKAKLYRAKKITLRDLLDQSGRPQTLQDLQRKVDPYFIEPIIDTKALKGARFQSSQLRDKFQKHAKHLGIETTKNNPKTQKQFQEKIIEFMNDENVKQKGTYKNKNNKVWYNAKTKVVIVFDKNSSFLTALQLADDLQYRKYIEEDFLW